MPIFPPGLKNVLKTILTATLFVVFITTLGYYLNHAWFWYFLVCSVVFCLLVYLACGKALLLFLGAKKSTDSQLNEAVAAVAPNLKVFFVKDGSAKLFSIDRSICLTDTTLKILNRQELLALVTREFIHIKNGDTKLRNFVTVLVGPLSVIFLELIISGSLEAKTDIDAVSITSDPESLANALEKTGKGVEIAERVKLLRSL